MAGKVSAKSGRWASPPSGVQIDHHGHDGQAVLQAQMPRQGGEAFGQPRIRVTLDLQDQMKVARVGVADPHDQVGGHGDDLVFECHGFKGPGIRAAREGPGQGLAGGGRVLV
jgi:hypothetical protein